MSDRTIITLEIDVDCGTPDPDDYQPEHYAQEIGAYLDGTELKTDIADVSIVAVRPRANGISPEDARAALGCILEAVADEARQDFLDHVATQVGVVLNEYPGLVTEAQERKLQIDADVLIDEATDELRQAAPDGEERSDG